MIQNSLDRGGEKDRFRILGIHEIHPGDDLMERDYHPLRVSRITSTTGDLLAVLCNRPGRPLGIPMVVRRGGVDLGVVTQLLVRGLTLGRLGPSSSHQMMPLHSLVAGVSLAEDLETGHLSPPMKLTGEVGRYPGEVQAQTNPLRLLPPAGS